MAACSLKMPYEFEHASILIVDDMPAIVNLLRQVLKIFGFTRIIIARDGQEAFEKFCKHNPDIVLTDWIMPGMNGLDFTKKIRNDPKSPNPYVPVIMVTGFCTKNHVENARDAGVNEFLIKPFSSRDLFTRIEQAIENPRDFVKTKVFFGPDRRRRLSGDFSGDKKRYIDHDSAQTDQQYATNKEAIVKDTDYVYNDLYTQNILTKLRQETHDLMQEEG